MDLISTKRFLIAGFTLLALAATPLHADKPIRLSEPVSSDDNSETFGSELDLSLPKFTLSGLMNEAKQHVGKAVLIETRIGKVCQKKGCFFVAMDGALSVRVSFRDYGFFIPTNSGNKTVTLAGELVERDLTPKQAAHFNKDMGGDSKSLAAGKAFEIVADSVRIARKSS